MEIINKQLVLEKPENLSVGYIESFIEKSGYSPLRWSIVKAESDKLTIDAVLIKD